METNTMGMDDKVIITVEGIMEMVVDEVGKHLFKYQMKGILK
jgi:hypothetical protein